MKTTTQIFDSNIGTIVTEDEKTFILAKEFSFYKLDFEKLASLVDVSSIHKKREIADSYIYTMIMIVVTIVSILLYMKRYTYTLFDSNYMVSTFFLLLNIPIHELGHIIFLKIFYPDSKFKVGFKFVFIFPAFYVDTSYSYMLPKYKKIAVFLAGNFMNSIFLLIITLFFPIYLPYCYILFSNILVNFLPIVKSDGYYAIKTSFNSINIQKTKLAEYIEDFIRGFAMFVFLKILSYL